MPALDKPGIEPLPEMVKSRSNVRFAKRGSSLGLTATTTRQLIQQIEAGFSFSDLLHLASQTGLDVNMLGQLIGISERTLARRKASSRLSGVESERLLRIGNVFEQAVELFEGDVGGAIRWLTNPKKALSGQQPLSYARTELGAREVENLIGRLEHGVFS